MFKFLMLKDRIYELNQMSDNMLESRKGHNYIRTCGYYEDYEEKLKERYPKTFKKYLQAKERWYKAYDDTQEEWEKYTKEQEYRSIIRKQYQLDRMENEIQIIKKEVQYIKDNLEKEI